MTPNNNYSSLESIYYVPDTGKCFKSTVSFHSKKTLEVGFISHFSQTGRWENWGLETSEHMMEPVWTQSLLKFLVMLCCLLKKYCLF